MIDRQSAVGKRGYAMILMTARLGLRISDLRQLELGDLDWRAKTLKIVQRKTDRPLSLPLLDDVGWAVIDYDRHGRPETACAKVFVKFSYPFDAFGCSSSVATSPPLARRLRQVSRVRHAAFGSRALSSRSSMWRWMAASAERS